MAAYSEGWSYMRIYFAPDTRVSSLLFGALLAAAWTGGYLPRSKVATHVRRIMAIAAVAGIAVLLHNPGWIVLQAERHRITWLVRPGEDFIYGLVALGTAVVIWELLESTPHLGHRLLAWMPLRAIGRISYPSICGMAP